MRQELEQLGWVVGRNLQIDVRWAALDAEATQQFAKELVASQPDLILSNDTPTTAALLQQTRTIPIVFVTVSDPVGSGFVQGFARPGGNATGFSTTEGSLGSKWLELLREIAPHVVRTVLSFNPTTGPYFEYYSKSLKSRVLRGGRFHCTCSRHVRI